MCLFWNSSLFVCVWFKHHIFGVLDFIWEREHGKELERHTNHKKNQLIVRQEKCGKWMFIAILTGQLDNSQKLTARKSLKLRRTNRLFAFKSALECVNKMYYQKLSWTLTHVKGVYVGNNLSFYCIWWHSTDNIQRSTNFQFYSRHQV